MKRVTVKLRDRRGSGELQAVFIFLIGMLLLSITFEYIRIHLIASNIRDAFERAVRTVASENYDEVYTSFKEQLYTGGYYEGGAGGGGDRASIPEWVPVNDTADVYEELAELLDLNTENEALSSSEDNYTLSDINIRVKNADVSGSGKYEAKGSIRATLPLHFAGLRMMDVNITLRITTAYSKKY